MKKLIYLHISIIVIFAIVYVLFAFCIWDLDCSNWSEISRIAAVTISVTLSACAYASFALNEADKSHK